jgi:hypothetical protein
LRSSEAWFYYVWSAKRLVKAAKMDKYAISGEFAHAVFWLYHYDVIAQFGLRHWRRRHRPNLAQSKSPGMELEMRDNSNTLTALVQNVAEVRLPQSSHALPEHVLLHTR